MANPFPKYTSPARTIVVGTQRPVRTSRRFVYDPTRGPTYSEEWEGIGESSLDGLANVFIQNRVQFDHTISPIRSRIVATATNDAGGFTGQSVDTWQLVANEIQQPIATHPAVQAMVGLDSASLSDLLTAVNAYKEGEGGDFAEWFGGTSNYEGRTTKQNLFRLMIHDDVAFYTTQYVLRHTTNVGNDTQGNVSDANVLSNYSASQLIAEAQDSGLWTFPMPTRLRSKINAIPTPAVNDDYKWGWLKKASTETTAANNRIDISTEYWFAAWSRLLYPYIE